MSDVFISYSRRDKDFVQALDKAFKSKSREVWVDWEDIPLAADWMREIHNGIETADNFLFVISPDSVASEICTQELTYAIDHHKRIVPILRRDVPDYKALHKHISSHNWIYFRESDDFDRSFESLLTTIDTDLNHVRSHTRLLSHALEWNEKGQDSSLLLRGNDLLEAENWLAQSVDKHPQPTPIQSQYIFASRKAATFRQRVVTGAVVVGLIVSLLLTAFAITQAQVAEVRRQEAVVAQATAVAERDRANFQSRVALSRQLAAQSLMNANGEIDLALLLSLEANRVADEAGADGGEVKGSLLDALQSSPHLDKYLRINTDWVRTVAISPDGKTLASGSRDNQIVLWDMVAQKLIGMPLSGHTNQVRSLAFSPDGKILASSGNDMTVILWDTLTWEMIGEPLAGHTKAVRGLAFSPDGSMVASGSEDGTVIFWDTVTREMIGEPLVVNAEGIRPIAFSPDGKVLASGGLDQQIVLWDVSTREMIGEPLKGHASTVQALAFSPNGKILASGSIDKTIILWDVATGEPLKSPLTDHRDFVLSVVFSPDGTLLASSSADETVRLWDVETGLPLGQPFTGHTDYVNSVVFTPDGAMLASGSDDRHVILWTVNTRDTILAGHTNEVLSVAYSPDGKLIASSSADETIRLWDAQTGETL